MGIVVHIIAQFLSGCIGGLTVGKTQPKLSLGPICDFIVGGLGGFILGLLLNRLGISASTTGNLTIAYMFLCALCGAAAVAIVAGIRKLF